MDVFGGAPRFLAYPRTFTVQSGADAVLKCRITGDPCPTVIWEKDKSPIEILGRCHVQAEGDVHSLSISRVTPADSGQYVCKAKNTVGETYAAASLQVEVEQPQQEGAPGAVLPSFLIKPLSLQVCRGEDVVFTCRVSGQPCPVLAWEKDGHKLSDLFESGHFCVGQEPEDWHFLKIFSARPPDGGVYVCRARNRSGEALAAAVLLVDPVTHGPPAGPILGSPGTCLPLSHVSKRKEPHGDRRHCCRQPPGQSSEPWPAWHNGELVPSAPRAKAFAVREGKHAKFRCYVTGKPKPEIVWKKAGKVVAPDRRHLVYEDREGYFTLKVLYCRARDQGLYICTASNAAGQTLSAVQLHVKEHRVRFQVQLEDVEVQERQDAVLECKVPLETIPTAWYLEDKPLQPSQKYVIEEQGLVRRLTVRDARTDDDGIYLCEMKDRGRSVAELSVRGTIVKRLPRKLDVMEGENAAFCVETQEAVEGICWSRNGLELRETPCTVLKSFGKTHLLVLVHVTREDAGVISFTVGESQTSAQLRVKCAKRVPPSAPVAAEMSAGCSNAALLTWCPGPEAHRSPPSSYILERQEASTAEWVQCLTTDLASMVEVPGDSVPVEADYCFRICAVNKYGRSRPVEFPGSVHLVPVACVRRALKDVQVQAGEDAHFSLELSASVGGQWLLNGATLAGEEAGQRYCIQHSGTEHSLRIRGVLLAESGAQVRFLASGVQDSATLRVQAPQVRIAPVPEAQRRRELLAGLPLLLECEVSTPDAPVRWLKDGEAVPTDDGIAVQSEGCARRLFIRFAGPSDSGTYTCDAGEDAVSFTVTVTEPPVRIVSSNEDAAHTYLASGRVVLACELSRADAPVQWYKDGVEVEEGESLILEREGPHRRLVIPSARPQDTGEFVCDAGGDSVFYNITVTEPPVRIVSSNEDAAHTYLASERVVLACELSRAHAPVQWYKDGVEVEEGESLILEREGPHRRLVIPLARPQDTGEFVCYAGGDSVFYNITVTEPPVRIVSSNEDAAHSYLASGRVVLACELSRADAPVQWYKDGVEVEEGESLILEREGPHRRLVIPSARPQDTGEFVCDVGGNSVFYNITVTAPQVRIAPLPEAQRLRELLAGLPLLLECEVSTPDAPVHWLKDREAVPTDDGIAVQSEGCARRLFIRFAGPSDSGTYTCDAGEDAVSFTVTVTEPPVRIVSSNEDAAHTYLASERVVLACELSRADAPVQWYKDGVEVEEGEGLILEREGPHRRLIIPSARPQDPGEFVCDAGGDSVFYNVTVTEPPVRILRPQQRSLELRVLALERLELRCELSVAEARVRWFKDGLEVDETENLLLWAEGAQRCLAVPQARAEDAGEYICETRDESVSFDIRVSGEWGAGRGQLPVLVPSTLCSSWVDPGKLFPLLWELTPTWCQTLPPLPSWLHGPLVWPWCLRLSCSADGPWRGRSGPCTRPVHAASCSARAPGDGPSPAPPAITPVALLLKPPVKILQPRRAPPMLKALVGETVTLACELSRCNAPVRWAKDGARLQADGSLILEEEGGQRRLVIPAAGVEHSGKYVCDAADDSRTFTVQVSEPPVRILGRGELQTHRRCLAADDLVLEVTLSHAHGEVKWYKDGEKLQETGRLRLEEDGVRRSLLILGLECEDAGEYLCDSCDDSLIFSVTVQEPPVSIVGGPGHQERQCLAAGGDLVVACEVSWPGAAVRWLRDGQELVPSERVRIEARGPLRQLSILGVRPSDSGSYVCDAGSDRLVTAVEVAAPPVRIVNKEEAERPVEVVEGESVALLARLSQETAPVQWLKNKQPLRSGARLLLGSAGPSRSLTIKQAEPGDSGTFSCDAGDDEVHFTLRVREAPVLFVNKQEKPEKVLVLEGGSAVLSAIVSKEEADVSWTGPRQPVAAGPRCELRREGRVHSLVLSNVGKGDAGLYACLSRDDRMQFEVSVKELLVKFVRGLSDVQAHVGETVLLWCELCKAKGQVVWLKDGRELQPSRRWDVRAEGRECSLALRSVGLGDAGEYSCESKDDRTLATLTVQVPRVVEILAELHNLTVLEGDDATFKCLVSPEDVALSWQLNGRAVVPSERLLVTRNGLCHALTVRQCQPGDAATVSACAEGLVSTARLSVQEAQVLFVQTLQDMVAEERQDVALEVELSCEAAEVRWLKQGLLVQPGSKYQLREAGRRRSLTIRSLSPSDRGTYRCESLHDRTQAKLSVAPRKVSVRKPLLDVATVEKETATFQLELSHEDVPGMWTRDGIRVKPSRTCRVSATGRVHSLTLLGLTLEDSGTVTFTADTLRSSARLTVREPPVTMVRAPRDVGVPETGAASFECELSRPLAEVTWYKDGTALRPGPTCRVYSVGRRRLLQLSHCRLQDAGQYTCDAGDCRASATLRVYERQVQVVQALADVRVRESENAVFTCQLSCEDVPGEWFRNGEKIKVTSSVKIRQEGPRHFLLICNVRPEDAGRIRFVAKAAASEASLQVEALPIRIVKPLRDKTGLAGHKATLECTVSQARGRVRWFRGDTEIFASDKYEICNLDCYRTLVIHRLGPQDEGPYTCDALDARCTARLLVEGHEGLA
ncbi:obscurin-like protein 1 [Emydura macquarii macquarii]|uniref:obscurin-like protein 1 n=1 Tax=Emydura macquarii macquarii TaxID=1129001 RepID=UPI003529DA79